MKKTNITHASNEVTPNAFQALLVGNSVFKNLAFNMDTKLLIRLLESGYNINIGKQSKMLSVIVGLSAALYVIRQ